MAILRQIFDNVNSVAYDAQNDAFVIKLDFNDWFDIREPDHIRAFTYLQKHGLWPIGFIPENISFNSSWYLTLTERMAKRYAELFMVGLDD